MASPASARSDVARLLERFTAFGAAPSASGYLALFHPDAMLFDSGMERPINLAGDRVIRGRRYYDRRPLYAVLAPDLPSLPGVDPELPAESPRAGQRVSGAEGFAEASARGWRRGRPSCCAALAPAFPDLELELEQWAGNASLVFLEWKASASVGGAPLRFGVVDRFELADGRARGGRAYFDTLALASRLAQVAR
jgi:hypothetical protein